MPCHPSPHSRRPHTRCPEHLRRAGPALAAAWLLAWGGAAAGQEAHAQAVSDTTTAVAAAGNGNGSREDRAGLLDDTVRRFTEGWKEPGGHWRVALSPYTYHWNPSEQHREVYAIGFERQRADGWLAGASRFRNSFGQPSAYIYLGWRSGPLWEQEQLFWQWSGGLLYGYRGEFKNKVPANVNGFSPGALLSLGWHTSERSAVMVHALAAAGLMLQLSWDLR
jgi:hypothetical protein